MSIYDYPINTIEGSPFDWSRFRNQVLLIVNTASKCGYSRQFAGLQQLYVDYKEQGFAVLGFPCNQFNAKEPGDHAEIQAYCDRNFGVTFPLSEKIEVRGPSAHPLFQYLTETAPFQGFDLHSESGAWMDHFLQEKYPDILEGDGIKWNFTKFLVDRSGQVINRYEPTVEPANIEADLARLLSLSR
ncbi:glutathione peroxidase [Paenibacillus cellulosilyticus]|uniref:Glutathione peroxidase n=1 Tax=Paenibacillus cellulosilyticus TaxID=375489 RepID=A0A2V2YYG4_9BACL|nr:glutathione peroxidase [Paenibacillus cellulosilyticus]PWV98007.1 glutathione peroxidase [Paenibacillus cellulosilyticus]QKS43968.1 glutathione peroxidase [Paenibacillus cellulosilyticus]